jgi:uncharacterized protein (DUF58 family)
MAISPSGCPELVLRPALCLLGNPLGVGIAVLSTVLILLAMGVATLLPSLRVSVSVSLNELAVEIDMDWE